jgi:glycosyltransferase involved in cell wall biosynthesis
VQSGPITPPTIVSMGRLERFKGHHRIIEALPHILVQRPEAQLFIAGAGPYEGALWELARKLGVADSVTIEFVPMSERERLAGLLAAARVVVLLSEYETHPIAVLEAAALGTPALVAEVAGLRELAEDGLAQAFPLTGTPRELARAVLQQFDEPFIPRKIDLPTWDDCTRALIQLYEAHARP